MQKAPKPRPTRCPCFRPREGLASPSQGLLYSMATLVTKQLVLALRCKVQGLFLTVDQNMLICPVGPLLQPQSCTESPRRLPLFLYQDLEGPPRV